MVHVVLLIRGNIRYFCGLIEDLLVTETYTCCLVLRRDVSPLYKLVMQPLITLGTFWNEHSQDRTIWGLFMQLTSFVSVQDFCAPRSICESDCQVDRQVMSKVGKSPKISPMARSMVDQLGVTPELRRLSLKRLRNIKRSSDRSAPHEPSRGQPLRCQVRPCSPSALASVPRHGTMSPCPRKCDAKCGAWFLLGSSIAQRWCLIFGNVFFFCGFNGSSSETLGKYVGKPTRWVVSDVNLLP